MWIKEIINKYKYIILIIVPRVEISMQSLEKNSFFLKKTKINI